MGGALPDWITSQPIAHRGLHDATAGVIENTGAAFERAAANHYAIELDVLPSADGEAIVFHDETLSRLCGRDERVRVLPARTLGEIDIAGTRDKVPTLGQVMARIQGRVPILIELKSNGESPGPLEARVKELLRCYGGPVAVQSFDPRSMAWFAAHAPDIPRGQLSMRYTREGVPQLGAARRFILTNLLASHLSKPDFIGYEVAALGDIAPRLARRLGLPLITWTVKSRAQWNRARSLADNLIFEGFAA
jgi:glycerophosphoryl diester phosphodiesterase